MNKHLFAVCALVGVMGLSAVGREVEDLEIRQHTETILGTIFIHREDCVDGVRRETWTIDGRNVTEQAYEEAILDAEKELRRVELRAEQERRRARQEGQLQVTLELHKKLLRLTIEQVETALRRCEDARLAPFLQFGVKGGLSKEGYAGIQDTLVGAKRLLSSQEDDVIARIKAVIAQLDPLPDRLEGLIQVSMNNTIKNCDDTKMLKELLGLAPLA